MTAPTILSGPPREDHVKEHHVGIVMNGVTGRMGTNQHLARSIVAIRRDGGVALSHDEVIVPEPILVGRNEHKLRALAEEYGVERWSTDLESCLADPENRIYFDAQITGRRAESVHAAIAAGKDVYCEKPIAESVEDALGLAVAARAAGVKSGIVQDKLFLPGIRKLHGLVESGFFGRILSVRGEFGYWVFEGQHEAPQRPSWNYRKESGGGIIVDMLCHWRYLIDNVFGPVQRVLCHGATHIPTRVDEHGDEYRATADDSAYSLFELEGGTVVALNSSWATRVHRGELLELHVDGTEGSAVAGLWDCVVQPRTSTPRATWNPDLPDAHDYRGDWRPAPDRTDGKNAFRIQWERFLRHVVTDEPFPWDFLEAAKGVQLAALGLRSWEEGRWLDVPPLSVDPAGGAP